MLLITSLLTYIRSDAHIRVYFPNTILAAVNRRLRSSINFMGKFVG